MGVLEVIGRKARGRLGWKVGLLMNLFFGGYFEGCKVDWIGEYCWFCWIVPEFVGA